MTFTAGGAAVVDAAPALIGDHRMRSTVGSGPAAGVMAIRAIGTEKTGMVGGIVMTAYTSGG